MVLGSLLLGLPPVNLVPVPSSFTVAVPVADFVPPLAYAAVKVKFSEPSNVVSALSCTRTSKVVLALAVPGTVKPAL